ncbi:hypothetical protein [Parafilimonas terrae]|nr:hypothetical protein [Parafilimonas terrae]
MRRVFLIIVATCLCAALFSSCVANRSSNCPSHDPNYWTRRR